MSIPIEELQRVGDRISDTDIDQWLAEVDRIGSEQEIKAKLKAAKGPNRVLFVLGYCAYMILGTLTIVGVCCFLGC